MRRGWATTQLTESAIEDSLSHASREELDTFLEVKQAEAKSHWPRLNELEKKLIYMSWADKGRSCCTFKVDFPHFLVFLHCLHTLFILMRLNVITLEV